MDQADLRGLLDYHYWARDVMLEAVTPLTPEQFTRQIDSSFKSVRDTLAHIYAAEWLWYARWQSQVPTSILDFDPGPDVPSIRTAWAELEGKVRLFVNGLGEAGVSRVFDYKAMNGQPTSSPFWQMLVHVVNHGSYHRGQVTTLLRQLGAAPPKSTDMITFHRLDPEWQDGQDGQVVTCGRPA
jgi:uncharacterized damage-inducible protein DinB